MHLLSAFFQEAISPLSVWQGIIVVVATWLVTGGFVYGMIKNTISTHEKRIIVLELDMKDRMVPRREFDEKHKENVKRMERIEGQGQRIEGRLNQIYERRSRPRE